MGIVQLLKMFLEICGYLNNRVFRHKIRWTTPRYIKVKSGQLLYTTHGNNKIPMTEFRIIKIPVPLADIIDNLIESGGYSSRAEYVKETIRYDLRKRGLLGGESDGN